MTGSDGDARAAGSDGDARAAGRGNTRAAGSDDFLSGTSGEVSGMRATAKALAGDAVADLALAARGVGPRLRRAARAWPARAVLALAVEREDKPGLLAAARREVEASHHRVTFVAGGAGDHGKFQNLNRLLEAHPAAGHDWLLVLDDDVALPAGFLDAFVFLAERFGLALAQPAHRMRSHAAYALTRRHPGSVVRETRFVEIGPVFAFHSATFASLLPFPDLRYGWGLDAHWAALAAEHGWRQGVVDATPVAHGVRRIASGYPRDAAVAEAREFLAKRAYLPVAESQRVLATHRSWR